FCFPPLGHRPNLGVYESRGQGIEDLLQHGWERGSALHFGSDRLEVDEPRLEDGACQPLERLRRPAVVLDLVVQGAEDGGDAALFGDGWNEQRNGRHYRGIEVRHRSASRMSQNPGLNDRMTEVIVGVFWVKVSIA